jgi:iron(III) transport system substrate-binding protein
MADEPRESQQEATMKLQPVWRTLALSLAIAAVTSAGCTSAPTASAPASDASAGADGAWDEIVAAAKREGQVVVIGPAGVDVQESLVAPFERRFPDIHIEYTSPAPPQIPPKLLTERAAEKYTTDLIIVGTTTIVGSLLPANALDPIQPFLVGPDAREASAWRGGKYDFADEEERYNLVALGRVQVPFVYNPTMVSAGEFTSFQDLLNPKWKGRMAMLDPRAAGAALDIMTFLYTQPSLGKPYLEQLFAQEPVLSREDRQLLDWVARGQYPIAIGPSVVQAYELRARGLPLELFPGEGLREGSFIAASNGTIAVADRAPHPNATRVYLNYILSREGQEEWSKASGLASRRRDVPTDHLPEFVVPRDGVAYQENYKQRYVTMRDEVSDFVAALFRNAPL